LTIPNVTMRWCQNRAECKWCQQYIEPGQPLVAVLFWNRGSDGRRWNTQQCYHPQCWIEQGLDYLKRNPYVPYRQGRKGYTELSVEDKRKRFLLVRKFHALEQRRKNIRAEFPESLLVESMLTKQMAEIMLDVARLGGVPKSWVKKLS